MTNEIANREEYALDLAEDLNRFPVDRDALDSVVSFDEAIAAAQLDESQMVFTASVYRVVTDKNELLATPFFIRFFRIAVDEATDRPYAVAYAITRENEMVIITDGSTGIFAQLRKVARQRLDEGHPIPNGAILVVNGLRKSEYGIDKNGTPVAKGVKPASMAATFYLA